MCCFRQPRIKPRTKVSWDLHGTNIWVTRILVLSNFPSCCDVPIMRNSVLSSFNLRPLFNIQKRMYLMQSFIFLTTASWPAFSMTKGQTSWPDLSDFDRNASCCLKVHWGHEHLSKTVAIFCYGLMETTALTYSAPKDRTNEWHQLVFWKCFEEQVKSHANKILSSWTALSYGDSRSQSRPFSDL